MKNEHSHKHLLETARFAIEKIDAEIYTLLEKRNLYSLHIKEYKEKNTIAIFQPNREKELYQHYGILGAESFSAIWKEIFAYSKRIQGLQCYILDTEVLLYAKLCLGFSTKVECIVKEDYKENKGINSILFMEESDVMVQDTCLLGHISVRFTVTIHTGSKKVFVVLSPFSTNSIQEFSLIL